MSRFAGFTPASLMWAFATGAAAEAGKETMYAATPGFIKIARKLDEFASDRPSLFAGAISGAGMTTAIVLIKRGTIAARGPLAGGILATSLIGGGSLYQLKKNLGERI